MARQLIAHSNVCGFQAHVEYPKTGPSKPRFSASPRPQPTMEIMGSSVLHFGVVPKAVLGLQFEVHRTALTSGPPLLVTLGETHFWVHLVDHLLAPKVVPQMRFFSSFRKPQLAQHSWFMAGCWRKRPFSRPLCWGLGLVLVW